MNLFKTKNVLLLTLLFLGTFGFSQSFDEIIKLTAADALAGDGFGYDVSISGNLAILGANGSDDAGSYSGSAYIFELVNGNWSQKQKLTASDAAAGDQFGYSVSISGSLAIVGAWYNDDDGTNSGAAYIFELENGIWSEKIKLTASDAVADDYFGRSVSISGNSAIVGAYLDDDNGTESGSVYIFELENSTWSQKQKLTAPDGAAADEFGYSVYISGNFAIVGAALNGDAGAESGSAYIFELDNGTWSHMQKLTASDAAAGDRFGRSVSISGNLAIVGAYKNGGSGSAYIYELDNGTWSEMQNLTASDPATDDYFGLSVSISEYWVIVSAHANDDVGTNSGSAYIFELENGTWTQKQKLTSSDLADGDYFGYSVSISGNLVIMGASSNDDDGANSGSAYIFEKEPTLVSSISIQGENGATTIITDNGTLQMEATLLPTSTENKSVTWSVADGTGSATIDTTGLLTAVSDGTVIVKATSVDGSSIEGTTTITISNQTTTGLSNTSLANKVSVYPNPATEEVNIESQGLKIETVSILDITGNLIKDVPSNKIIDISDLEKGVYILQLKADNNVINKRFIKE